MSKTRIHRTKDDIEKELNDLGYELLEQYQSKVSGIKVIIKDEIGYLYDICFRNAIKNKIRPFSNKNSYTLYNIKLWLDINNKNFTISDDNKYNGEKENLKFYCFECEEYFYSGWSSIHSGQDCAVCAGRQVGERHSFGYLRPEFINEWIKSEHNLTPYDVSRGSGEKVLWCCLKCKHKWTASVNDREQGKGCPKCNESKGEKEVSKILEKYNINYIPQYKFNDCKYIRPLPFDFYLLDYNILIEYDSILHYEMARWFTKEKAQKKLEDCQRNDKIKTQYCLNNDVPLLRIHYKDFKNIEQILISTLNL